jgi:ParB/RepB/Spo0J family partition protein
MVEISLDLILPDPKNRKEHDPEKLRSLAASIIEEGLLQPIVVRPFRSPNGAYMIVAGERRFRACRFLKYAKIPAIVLDGGGVATIGPVQAARKRLVENLQREDLTPIEEARLYRELVIDHKSTQADVAKLAGRSQPAIANALRLLELPAEVQQIIQDGQLTRAHGITLVRFAKWPKVCTRIAQLAAKQGTTTKDLEHEAMPFDRTLAREKLVIEIDTSGNSYDRHLSYKIPQSMLGDPAFIDRRWCTYCLEPEKWAPEKARQDAEHAKKAAEQKKQEKAQGGKMSPKEKADRRKVIAENKRRRAEGTAKLEAAYTRLKATKSMDKVVLAEVVAKVLQDNHYASALKEAAAKIGMDLPPRLTTDSWFSKINWEKLLTLSETDMVRLTAAAIATYHGRQAIAAAYECPNEVKHLAATKKGGAK